MALLLLLGPIDVVITQEMCVYLNGEEYTQTDEDNQTYTYTRFYMSDETSIMTENTSTAPIVGQYYWTQTAPNNAFSAEGYADRHGHSVSLSSNGLRFVAGAINNDGTDSDAGHVRAYLVESQNQ